MSAIHSSPNKWKYLSGFELSTSKRLYMFSYIYSSVDERDSVFWDSTTVPSVGTLNFMCSSFHRNNPDLKACFSEVGSDYISSARFLLLQLHYLSFIGILVHYSLRKGPYNKVSTHLRRIFIQVASILYYFSESSSSFLEI